MTTIDRFDPFERRISEAIDEIAAARRPDYLDDIFQLTARTSQRPRWSFLERWLPMDTALSRPMLGRRLPLRPLIVLALLTALVAGSLAVYFGSQKRLPLPYGPAANGQLIYGFDGDIYARDSLTAEPRLLLRADGNQSGIVVSPDGQLVAYDHFVAGQADPYEWVVNVDGSNPRQILDRPYTFDSFEWAPDSRSIAIVTRPTGTPELWVAPADGSGATQVQPKDLLPWSGTWDPLRPGVLLVRAQTRATTRMDLYYVTTRGEILQAFGRKPLGLNGPPFELSGAAFSPDGQTIAYNSIEAEEFPVNRFRAHLINRDGTNDRVIPAPFDSNFSQAWPAFSPDGKWVLLSTWRTEGTTVQHRLAIAPADGSGAAKLIGPVLDDENQLKSWSPDGSRIVLCACSAQEVYTVDPISGDFERLPWRADAPSWQRLALP